MKGNKQVCFKENHIDTMGLHFKQMDPQLEGILDVCVRVYVFSTPLLFVLIVAKYT